MRLGSTYDKVTHRNIKQCFHFHTCLQSEGAKEQGCAFSSPDWWAPFPAQGQSCCSREGQMLQLTPLHLLTSGSRSLTQET